MKATVSMEGILGMLHTLSAADKRWLADRLYEDADRKTRTGSRKDASHPTPWRS